MTQGLFGPCVNRLIPGRSKFDPDLHPGFAPSVPSGAGDDYLRFVEAECPVDSGELLGSLELEERDGKAWVSSDTLHGGIILEWGSCHIPPSRILSRAAARAKAALGERLADKAKAEKDPGKALVDRIRAERLIQEGRMQKEADALREAFRKRLAATLKAQAQGLSRAQREELGSALLRRFVPTQVPQTEPILESIKAQFRSTLERASRRPSRRVIETMRRWEPLRDPSDLARLLLRRRGRARS